MLPPLACSGDESLLITIHMYSIASDELEAALQQMAKAISLTLALAIHIAELAAQHLIYAARRQFKVHFYCRIPSPRDAWLHASASEYIMGGAVSTHEEPATNGHADGAVQASAEPLLGGHPTKPFDLRATFSAPLAILTAVFLALFFVFVR